MPTAIHNLEKNPCNRTTISALKPLHLLSQLKAVPSIAQAKAFNRESTPPDTTLQTHLSAKLATERLRLLHLSIKQFCKKQPIDFHGHHRVCA